MRPPHILLVCIVTLFAAPALFACDKCLGPDGISPAGNRFSGYICWSGYADGYAWCNTVNPGPCAKGIDSTCKGGGGGGVRHQDFFTVGSVDLAPVANNCAVDVSGSCSGKPSRVDSFLR